MGITASVFALFDRDYRCRSELDKLAGGLAATGIKCQVWECKEIENYALSVAAIHRVVTKKSNAAGGTRTISQVSEDLMSITEPYGEYVRKQCLEHSRAHYKGATGDAETNDRLSKWETLEGRLEIGPGKKIVHDMCGYYKSNFNISLSLYAIIDEL